ncbi:MAG TPA: methylated-DNA--[protein]-cysteine S-methyltransferase [Candidatus Babeliales bacterium]|nr:methylated-DNA--[protein]-cysteine S-methyltransferase [Candidatus Babeliales bacterium]
MTQVNQEFLTAVLHETSNYEITNHNLALKVFCIETPLGSMFAMSDEYALYFLEFTDHFELKDRIKKFCYRTNSTIIIGSSVPITSITTELTLYFDGSLKKFKTPLQLLGSPFQKSVWKALQSIPYGHTRSYTEQAKIIEKESAYRAVANANGANKISIVIPCHRVINSNGNLGGYGGGLARKKWLLDFERKNYDN